MWIFYKIPLFVHLYKILFFLFTKCRRFFISLNQATCNPFVLSREFELTFRFFRELYTPTYLALLSLLTQFCSRHQYTYWLSYSYLTLAFTYSEYIHPLFEYCNYFTHKFCTLEYRRMDYHTKIFHLKKSIKRTLESEEIEKGDGNETC